MTGGVPVTVLVRTALVLVGAVAVVVVGRVVPLLPDLVLPVVIAAALLRGPVTGALVGLGAGWVLDLMPPGSAGLGTAALLYAAAGAAAGLGRRPGAVSVGRVGAAALAAVVVVVAGRVALALLSGAQVDPSQVAEQLGVSALAAVVLLVPLLRLERRLARDDR